MPPHLMNSISDGAKTGKLILRIAGFVTAVAAAIEVTRIFARP